MKSFRPMLVRCLLLALASTVGATASEMSADRPIGIVIRTELGDISLTLHHDAAPRTSEHVTRLIQLKAYDGRASFYRSDFVIQGGLHPNASPLAPLQVNEAGTPKALTNARGTAALGHFDVPDNGNSELFINLQASPHLDTVYGGYAVFASIEDDDVDSFAVVDAIASTISSKKKQQVQILEVGLRFDAQ